MLKRIVGTTFAAAALAFAGMATAAEVCEAPGPPPDQSLRPVAPTKPAKPACVNEETRVATCRPAVLKAYNVSIDAYNAALVKFNVDGNAYIETLNHWAHAAVNYTNCEVQLLNHEVMQ